MSSPSETKPAATAAPVSTTPSTPLSEVFARLKAEHAQCVNQIQTLEEAKKLASSEQLKRADELEAQAATLRKQSAEGSIVFDVLLKAEDQKREYLEAEGNKLLAAKA